jgi:hypothetical protein
LGLIPNLPQTGWGLLTKNKAIFLRGGVKLKIKAQINSSVKPFIAFLLKNSAENVENTPKSIKITIEENL